MAGSNICKEEPWQTTRQATRVEKGNVGIKLKVTKQQKNFGGEYEGSTARKVTCGPQSNCIVACTGRLRPIVEVRLELLPESRAEAQAQIQAAIKQTKDRIPQKSRGRANFKSISNFTNWVWESCSNSGGGRSGSSNWGVGSNTNRMCHVAKLGAINFDCVTSDYYVFQSFGSVRLNPDNAVSILSSEVERGVARYHNGNRVTEAYLRNWYNWEKTNGPDSGCGDACALEHGCGDTVTAYGFRQTGGGPLGSGEGDWKDIGITYTRELNVEIEVEYICQIPNMIFPGGFD